MNSRERHVPEPLFDRTTVRVVEQALRRQFGFEARRVRVDLAELIQETLLRALDHRGEFDGVDQLVAWCSVVLRNLIREHARSSSTRLVSLRADLDETAAGICPDASNLVAARDMLPIYSRLSERDRKVLWAREVERMTYKEIAREIDVPVAQVSAILARARRRLRDVYRLALGAVPHPLAAWWRRRPSLPNAPANSFVHTIAPVVASLAAVAVATMPATGPRDSTPRPVQGIEVPVAVVAPAAATPPAPDPADRERSPAARPREARPKPGPARRGGRTACLSRVTSHLCAPPPAWDENRHVHLHLSPLGDRGPGLSTSETRLCDPLVSNPLVACTTKG